MKKKLDEEIIIEWLVIPIVLVFAFTVWWLSSQSLVPREEETTTEITTRIVENIVENVENTDIPETDIIKTEDTPKPKELGTFKITGYTPTCSHCCLKSDGIGSSGRKIEAGKSVAMNRQDMRKYGFKYGDKIYIVGIGERVIEDTGCKQGVIDVACDSHESCYKVTGFYKVERVKVI